MTPVVRAFEEFALGWMQEQGMAVAMVETGGDPGHGPARQTYERAGFVKLARALSGVVRGAVHWSAASTTDADSIRACYR
jgi:hypothetical protein